MTTAPAPSAQPATRPVLELVGAETPAPEDTDVALTLRHQEEDET